MQFITKYKKQIILLSVLFIFAFIVIIINTFIKNDDVKTVKKENGSTLPEVNVEGANADAVNDYLEQLYNEYTSDGKSKFNYSKYTYNDIISVLVKIKKYDESNDEYVNEYLGFNINKDGSYLSKEDVAKLFNYELIDVYKIVEQKLNKYYEDERLQGYVAPDCDFKCYLSYVRNMENLLDNISLVIENDKLVVYMNLSIDTFAGDKEYFDSLDENVYRLVIE